jgi:hypothetical protein
MIRHESTFDLGGPLPLQLSTPDFISGQRLADRHAVDRDNAPPSLLVDEIPDGAR